MPVLSHEWQLSAGLHRLLPVSFGRLCETDKSESRDGGFQPQLRDMSHDERLEARDV
jgi:hypothetical protein